jgi:hypothetical protein
MTVTRLIGFDPFDPRRRHRPISSVRPTGETNGRTANAEREKQAPMPPQIAQWFQYDIRTHPAKKPK